MIDSVGYGVTTGCTLGVFNLDRLYGYCVLRLTQGNVRNDPAALAEVRYPVEPLVDGWRQIGVASAHQ